jgi:hypothetical protein
MKRLRGLAVLFSVFGTLILLFSCTAEITDGFYHTNVTDPILSGKPNHVMYAVRKTPASYEFFEVSKDRGEYRVNNEKVSSSTSVSLPGDVGNFIEPRYVFVESRNKWVERNEPTIELVTNKESFTIKTSFIGEQFSTEYQKFNPGNLKVTSRHGFYAAVNVPREISEIFSQHGEFGNDGVLGFVVVPDDSDPKETNRWSLHIINAGEIHEGGSFRYFENEVTASTHTIFNNVERMYTNPEETFDWLDAVYVFFESAMPFTIMRMIVDEFTDFGAKATLHIEESRFWNTGTYHIEFKRYQTLREMEQIIESVQQDLNDLQIGFQEGDEKSSVTQHIDLPKSGKRDTNIIWSSSDRSYLDVLLGRVKRPSFIEGDKNIELQAVVEKDFYSLSKQFDLFIQRAEPTDLEAVDLALRELENFYDSLKRRSPLISEDLALETSVNHNTVIHWESSDSSVLDKEGTVTRPTYMEGDAPVVLTVTVSRDSVEKLEEFELLIQKLPQTDAEAVKESKELLEIGFASGESASQITQDLYLPSVGSSDTSINWVSSNSTVINEYGNVHQPIHSDAEVTLTAEITRNDVVDTKYFQLTVLRVTDKESVALDIDALSIGFSQGDNEDHVTRELSLPRNGENATAIRWISNDPWVITSTGGVSRPMYTDGDKSLTLTATVSRGSERSTVSFPLTVVRNDPTDAEAVKLAVQVVKQVFENDIPTDSVTDDLTLPKITEYNVAISWISSDPLVITNEGMVEQPSYTQGSKTVRLTANLTRGNEQDIEEFTVLVPHLPQTNREAVIAANEALEVSFSEGDSHGSVTKNISLPLHGVHGTSVSWMTSDVSVISRSGRVTRPVYDSKSVKVSANIQKGDASTIKEFDLTVLRFSDEDSVRSDKDALVIRYASGESASSVRDNLVLSTSGQKGTSITWESSDEVYITNNGTVTRPAYSVGNKRITMTAVITRGSVEDTKRFFLNVERLSPTDTEMVEEAVNELSSRDIGYSVGDNARGITGNITLPTRGMHETVISWESSNAEILRVLGNSGQVTQPSYYDGDTEITLTVKVTKNSESAIKELTVNVEKAMFEIGDRGPAGGQVFFVDLKNEFEWTYLEVAPEATVQRAIPWGGTGTLVGGTSEGLGTGAKNTELITQKFGRVEPYEGNTVYAAKFCADFVYGGYSDWFLPSIKELEEFQKNLRHIEGFRGQTDYWSSSEYDDSRAYVMQTYWDTDKVGKNSIRQVAVSRNVVAIRAF